MKRVEAIVLEWIGLEEGEEEVDEVMSTGTLAGFIVAVKV